MQPYRTTRRRISIVRTSQLISSFPTRAAILTVTLFSAMGSTDSLRAQSTGWQPLTVSEGVEITFVVYRYGGGENAGAVIKLLNRNLVEATYRFRVIFRSDRREWISDPVEGVLQPLEIRTGELSGLWWIPFKDGAPITEVGLKGLRIRVSSHDERQNGSDTTS